MNSGRHPVDAAATERAAYLHIPFCRRKCPYCDFAVVDLSRGSNDFDRYVSALRDEIKMEPEWGPLHAVNLGGGTPSALEPRQIASLLDAVADRFGLVPGAEVSIEANPEDWNSEYAVALAGAGVNRVSLGVQSFDEDVLRYLGRRHTPGQGARAVMAARHAGIPSTNIDLIFGSPVESVASWAGTVASALELEPDHVSTYALTVERGTELSRAVDAGAPGPDNDDQADKYEHFAALAPSAGLVRYEVSNWARPGHTCRYNQTTWAHGEYVAFGTGAHGFRDGVRSRNVRRLDRYLESIEAGLRPIAGTEMLTGVEMERERLFVGLRRSAGVRAGELGRRFLEAAPGRRLLDAGVVTLAGDRLVVPNPLLTDAVARELLGEW
ncbi:MAG: radical SAM family heme chaperone HemW [Acidimicrobiia bacterium]